MYSSSPKISPGVRRIDSLASFPLYVPFQSPNISGREGDSGAETPVVSLTLALIGILPSRPCLSGRDADQYQIKDANITQPTVPPFIQSQNVRLGGLVVPCWRPSLYGNSSKPTAA